MQTSWENSAKKYGKLVGKEGSYYHQSVIFPQLLPLLDLNKYSSLLDLGCGQGVFSRVIDPELVYFGLDMSPTLIDQAKKLSQSKAYFKVQDVSRPFKLTKTNFSHVVFILSLQNMKDLDQALSNAVFHLHAKGQIFLILNHPLYRIPKYSDWVVDGTIQYRRVWGYMQPKEIPIDMNPGNQKQSTVTWSFHYSLQDYMAVFRKHRLVISVLEEWISDKVSVGKNAKRENVSREEIPMFMCIGLKRG